MTYNRPAEVAIANPYAALVFAILRRAVQDAAGHCDAPGKISPARLQQEARAWLQDEQAVTTLLELAGYEPDPVLRRLRPLLQPRGPVCPTERRG
jgi:hypothetical protein